MERPAKRQRTDETDEALPTPPASDCDAPTSTIASSVLTKATRVLEIQAAALAHINSLYQTDPAARQSLEDAVVTIVDAQRSRGKLIVCGVGKSAYIGMKLTATCKSLGVRASFLHACEAAHGDLGDVHDEDVLLFVTYSGKTPELLNLLPHIPAATRRIALTSQLDKDNCLLLRDSANSILLPAPIPEREQDSFGVSAPTTSTTVALAVADMLALAVADQLHGDDKKEVFKRNHPGGAIGMNHKEVEELKKDGVDVSILELPSPTISGKDGDLS